MNPVEKNMLVGAFATAGVDLALEANFMYQYAHGASPQPSFLYGSIHPMLPSVDDFIACLGTPLALYGLGKWLKKDSLVVMAKAGALGYGIPELIGMTMYKVVTQLQPTTLRYRLVGAPLR